MMYRLAFPLLIVAVLACIGIASAMGHNVLPDTVLDFLNGTNIPKERSELANLAGSQHPKNAERRSTSVSNGGASMPAGLFQDLFDMAQEGFPVDISASLAYQGTIPGAQQNYGFASGASSSGYTPRGSSTLPGTPGNQGVGSKGSSGSSGGGALAGGGVGGSGGDGGSSDGGFSPNLLLASLMTGSEDSGIGGSSDIPATGGSKDIPMSDGDPGVLPQTPQISHDPFVPQTDPLLGAPIQDVLPDANSGGQNPDPAPIPNPEPGTLILGGMGLAALIVARRRMTSRQGE